MDNEKGKTACAVVCGAVVVIVWALLMIIL